MTRLTTLKSVLMAIGVTVAATLWMLSGMLQTSAPERPSPSGSRTESPSSADLTRAPMRVTVQKSVARTVTRDIVVSARTEPNRQVELRAETDGRVVALGAERGQFVGSGQRIAGLDLRDRNARLAQARALIAQRELQYEAAQRLQGQQLIAEVQIAESLAALVGARAALEQIEIDIRHTTIRAPFDAMVDDRFVEIGDYVQSGDSVARLVDIDPMIIVGEVSEREVESIVVGATGSAKLVSGAHVTGELRYLAPVADDSTRTFRVELAVPNPDGSLRAGMTAEMLLSAEQITAHSLSAALLTLDDTGAVGVKAVNPSGRVEFFPVEIVSSTAEGVLLTGLPEELYIITVGQGFVTPGQMVEPVTDPTTARQRDAEHSGRRDSEPTIPKS